MSQPQEGPIENTPVQPIPLPPLSPMPDKYKLNDVYMTGTYD